MSKKIAWCITGGEYFLQEVLEFIRTLGPHHIKLYISKSGLEVIRFFELESLIPFDYIEERSNSGLELMSVLTGFIKKTVIAPCTSNTAAKLVYGISDSLCTNLAVQGQKLGIPTYILPTDTKDRMEFYTKSKKKIVLKRRTIDRENIEKLKSMEFFRVFEKLDTFKKEILNEIA